MAVTDQIMTLEEFEALLEEKPALEWENGRVAQKLPPDFPHSRLQSKLSELINRHAEPEHLGMSFTEARWTLAFFSRVPDLVVYRWDRLPLDERGRLRRGRVTEPPDIAVEIVSPGQSASSQLDRCLQFVAAGVTLALVIDPDDESVVIVREGGVVEVVRGDERLDLDAVLPGFELTAAQLFASLRPNG